jgi:phenylacetate-CoA ligase
VSVLAEQLAYLEATSSFYAARLRGVREHVRTAADLQRLPYTTKEELREGQRREPPFGPHLCAPREQLVRMHVTSGTTGDPVAVGFTRRDHEANSAVGGEAFRIAGMRPDDVVAHCLNYALYAGGIADQEKSLAMAAARTEIDWVGRVSRSDNPARLHGLLEMGITV